MAHPSSARLARPRTRVWFPEFTSRKKQEKRKKRKKLGMAEHACNLSAGKVETGYPIEHVLGQ